MAPISMKTKTSGPLSPGTSASGGMRNSGFMGGTASGTVMTGSSKGGGGSKSTSSTDILNDLKKEISRREFFKGRQDVSDDRLLRRYLQDEKLRKYKQDLVRQGKYVKDSRGNPVRTASGDYVYTGTATFDTDSSSPTFGQYVTYGVNDKMQDLARQYGPTFSEIGSDIGYGLGSIAKGAGDFIGRGGVIGSVLSGLYDKFKGGTQQGIETVKGLYDNLRSTFSGQPTVNYGGGSTITTTTNQPVIDLTPASIETETLPSMDLNRNIGNESDQSIFGITNTGVPLPFLRSTTDLPYNNISSFNPDTYQPGYLPEGYSNVGVAPIIPEYYQPNNTLGNIFLNSQGYEVPISNDLMSKRRPPSYLEQQDNYYYQNRLQSLPTGQQYYYADASQQDIDRINKMRQLKGMDPQSIYDMRDIFQLSPELTLEDIQGIKEGTITQPTGIFAKYGGSVDKYAGLGYKLK